MTTSTLIVYGIGDSVMWGQGLRKEHKFINTTGKALAREWGYDNFACYNFARSGAVVNLERNQASKTDYMFGDASYKSDMPYARELPCAFPTIFEQIDIADKTKILADTFASNTIEEHSNEDVNVILLNGGINDVDIKNILTRNQKAIKTFNENCYLEYINHVLPELSKKFPNAIIVVLGYFQIVGSGSNQNKTIRVLKYLENTTNYDAYQLNYAQTVQNITDNNFVTDPILNTVYEVAEWVLHNDYYTLLKIDTDEYDIAYRHAIQGAGFYYRHQHHTRSASVSKANSLNRCNAIYVDSGFTDKNCTLCSEEALFPLGGAFRQIEFPRAYAFLSYHENLNDFSPQDEVIKQRLAAINDFSSHYRGEKDAFNRTVRASIGHPNKFGSNLYKKSIVGQLKRVKLVNIKSVVEPFTKKQNNFLSVRKVTTKKTNEAFSSLRGLAYHSYIQSLSFDIYLKSGNVALFKLSPWKLTVNGNTIYFSADLSKGKKITFLPFKNKPLPSSLSSLKKFTLQRVFPPQLGQRLGHQVGPQVGTVFKLRKIVLVVNGFEISEFNYDGIINHETNKEITLVCKDIENPIFS